MPSIAHLIVSRDGSSDSSVSPTLIDLLIALLVLLFVALLLAGALFILRKVKKSRAAKDRLPKYEPGHRRQLTITTGYDGRKSSVYVYDEKAPMMKHAGSPPTSPVPEIRITFPDEQDEDGSPKSGRVVVVKIGDKGSVGLEPLVEQLPAYEHETNTRFQSLDLDRMGGLKEKEEWA